MVLRAQCLQRVVVGRGGLDGARLGSSLQARGPRLPHPGVFKGGVIKFSLQSPWSMTIESHGAPPNVC